MRERRGKRKKRGKPREAGKFPDRGPHFDTMSDGEVEAAPEVEAPAPSEPMDLMSALQMVLKKALAHNQLARGLPKGCNQNDYKKLVEALAREHNVDIVEVPKNTQLGEWCGLCKIDAEGNPRKVVKCSMAVVKDYGEDSEG